MRKGIVFIAIDVDDKSFHGCGIDQQSGEIQEFACRPTVGHLEKKLARFKREGVEVKICYEATYLGFSLCRDLRSRGYGCEVIAPSLIPEKAGKRVKTDRIDSQKMAEYYMKGLLTAVHVPTEEEEMVRGLVRSRKFLSNRMSKLKLHILSMCRRSGLCYKEGEGREQ